MIGTAANHEHDRHAALGEGPEGTTAATPQAPPSMRVVGAIAEATGRDPTTMAPLYRAVDTDAMDCLLDADTDTDVRFVFEYEGHEVEARADGYVAVDGREHEVSE